MCNIVILYDPPKTLLVSTKFVDITCLFFTIVPDGKNYYWKKFVLVFSTSFAVWNFKKKKSFLQMKFWINEETNHSSCAFYNLTLDQARSLLDIFIQNCCQSINWTIYEVPIDNSSLNELWQICGRPFSALPLYLIADLCYQLNHSQKFYLSSY